jgi:DNA-directed RNA polymerase subunit RPC12/RpoP
MAFGPDCPRCGNPVSFWSVQFGRGKAFACGRCGQRLVVPKAGTFVALGLFALLFANRGWFAERPYGWLIFALILLLLGIAEYMLLKVRAVGQSEPAG